jgi:hypothetical protein
MKIKLIQQSNLFKSLKVIEDTVRDDLINFSYFQKRILKTYNS